MVAPAPPDSPPGDGSDPQIPLPVGLGGCAALFGGTFDPVHCGHLIIAEQVRDALGLDQVLFVPCGEPPHKSASDVSPGHHRLRMLELAIAAHPGLVATDLELRRPGASYTIETVRHLKAAGISSLTLIIGSDSLVEMPTWLEPEAVLEESRVVVVGRRGAGTEFAPTEYVRRVTEIDCPLVDISSTDIRARVRAGRSIRFLVPEPVRAYIREQGLYGSPGPAGPDGVVDAGPGRRA